MARAEFRIGDVRIPSMALGTMYFGSAVAEGTAMACLDAAYDLGARFWDTANNYAFWAGGVGDESEQTIGRWLADRGSAARERVVLATKVGARPRTTAGGLEDVLGLSRPAIRAQAHDSLRRLQVDYVDVLYAHIDDHTVPLAETIGALDELVDEGKVREIAASNLTAPRITEALTVPVHHRYAAVQSRFTYLRPKPGADLAPHVLLDDDVVALCAEHRMTALGYSPLLSGAYDRDDRPLPEEYVAGGPAETAVSTVSGSHGLTRGQAVLAWMVGRTNPVVPVVGVSSAQQVQQAWSAVTTELTDSDLALLDGTRRA